MRGPRNKRIPRFLKPTRGLQTPLSAVATRRGENPGNRPAFRVSLLPGWPIELGEPHKSDSRLGSSGRSRLKAPRDPSAQSSNSLRTNPDTIPKHCRANHATPRHWADGFSPHEPCHRNWIRSTPAMTNHRQRPRLCRPGRRIPIGPQWVSPTPNRSE